MVKIAELMTAAARQVRARRTVLYLSILLLAALQNFRQPILLDDAYITFRSAQNLAQGKGLFFNPDEKVLSTTAPGYAILLAGLNKAGVDLAVAGRAVSALGLVLASLCLFQMAASRARPELGLAAALVLCFFPDLIKAWGNECALLIGLACLALLMLDRLRPVACAAAVTAGCMVRPDFALLGLTLAPVWAWRKRAFAIQYMLAGAVLSALWILVLHRLAGGFCPNTLAVKREQGLWLAAGDPRAFAGWIPFARGVKWLVRRIVFDRPIGIFILFGVLSMAYPRGLWGLFLAWAALHTVAYWGLGVPGTYGWYYYPLWLLFCVGAGVGFSGLVQYLKSIPAAGAQSRWQARLLLLSLAVYGVMNLYGTARDEWAERKFQAYRQMAEMIRQRVKPGETVLMNEIGQMGYMSGCRVIDTSGLIHGADSRQTHGDLAKVVARFAPDYLVNEGWLNYAAPDYQARVLAGTYELRVDLPDGRVIRYAQVDRVFAPPDLLPVLLKRQ